MPTNTDTAITDTATDTAIPTQPYRYSHTDTAIPT